MDRLENFVLSGTSIGHFWRANGDSLTPRSLKVTFGTDNFEAPDFLLCNIKDDALWHKYDTLFMHLSSEFRESPKKLVRGAIQSFEYSLRDGTIRGVNMANGGIYYGVPGAIFDENFGVLFMMTTSCRIKRDSPNDIGQLVFTKHNCRISPKVFQRADFTIEKALIKKVIPFCASHIVDDSDYMPGAFDDSEVKGTNIRIIIDDIDSIFTQTVVPPKISDSEGTFQKILKDSIGDIISIQ